MNAVLSPSIPRPDVLVLEDEQQSAALVPALRQNYTVAVTAMPAAAREYLRRVRPALIVIDLDLDGGASGDICREAKAAEPSPAVLVTTATTENVLDALAAGCDGVLLKPFPPNLFYARIGRILRAATDPLIAREWRQYADRHQVSETTRQLSGTNQVWPNVHCPSCDHQGVTSFEFASHRRAWYACLSCRYVWLAKRQEC